MNKHVLVTGGAGFIGSHLTERLIARGYKVRVLDNLAFGQRDWVSPQAEFVNGDITDMSACRASCEGIEGVFHMAAMSRSGPSINAAEFCTSQNIIGTQNMLVAARDCGVKRFVYSGSSTYYGNQPGPQTESLPPDLLNFYGFSKYAGEELCRLFDQTCPIECVSLRYFNVYGPNQPETGAYALVLGIFLNRWSKGQVLEIHGSGEQRRDFIHVRDVADANIAAMESNMRGSVYNIGSGVNISIIQLAQMISDQIAFTERRAGDADSTLADISRTVCDLKWIPKVSFDDGLSEMKYLARQARARLAS